MSALEVMISKEQMVSINNSKEHSSHFFREKQYVELCLQGYLKHLINKLFILFIFVVNEKFKSKSLNHLSFNLLKSVFAKMSHSTYKRNLRALYA